MNCKLDEKKMTGGMPKKYKFVAFLLISFTWSGQSTLQDKLQCTITKENNEFRFLAANVFIDPCVNIDNNHKENGGKSKDDSYFYLGKW